MIKRLRRIDKDMRDYEYVKRFENLGFGLFVHYGLFSIIGKGEWYAKIYPESDSEYKKLPYRFIPTKSWAKDLVRTASSAGCKYINITTRHHDGFSLYDTCGLSDFDAPHVCGRDLIAEFAEACRDGGIVPVFYHTLLDWNNRDYRENFPKYIDYLIKSVEKLCRNYGRIGGFWFDGMWDKPNADWQEDKLYGTIKKYQPTAMIINNTGLSELGKVGHPLIDSVTFERGKPAYADNSDRPRAGEMCQVLNDHWGYAKNDCNYKSVKELIENLLDCRLHNCNFLLNTGLRGNGKVNAMDKCLLAEVGKWIKANKGFIYGVKSADIRAENADILTDGASYYAVIKDVSMTADANVQLCGEARKVVLPMPISRAVWLDSGEPADRTGDNSFAVKPFEYGTSYGVRVAKIELK